MRASWLRGGTIGSHSCLKRPRRGEQLWAVPGPVTPRAGQSLASDEESGRQGLAGLAAQGTVGARVDIGSPDCEPRPSRLRVDTRLSGVQGAQGHSLALLRAGLGGTSEVFGAWPSHDRAASASGGPCGAPGLLLKTELGLEPCAQKPDGVLWLI